MNKGIFMDTFKWQELYRLADFYMNHKQMVREDALYLASKDIWEAEIFCQELNETLALERS